MSEKALQVSPQTLITWKWKAFQNKLKGVIKTERRLNGGKQRRKCINPPTLQLALLLQVKSELHYWNICDSSFGVKQEYRHSVHTDRVSTVRLPWASLLTTMSLEAPYLTGLVLASSHIALCGLTSCFLESHFLSWVSPPQQTLLY